jgi:hypothetical protein
MRKTFQLNEQAKNRERAVDAVKHEIRKYMKRERGHELPAGADYWHFDCKFGRAPDSAAVVHPASLMGLIDEVAQEGGDEFYVEIIARPGHRKVRPQPDSAASGSA